MASIYIKILLISVVIIFIAIAVNIYIIFHSNRASDICHTNSDCPDNFKCIYSHEYKKQICIPNSGIEFSTSNPTLCTPGKNSICTKGINEPPWGCVVVTWGTLTLTKPGTKYEKSSNASTKLISPVGGKGSGLTVKFNVSNGGAIDPSSLSIVTPGNNYKKGDELEIIGGDNTAHIKFIDQPSPYTVLDKKNKPMNINPSPPGRGWCLLPIDSSQVCNPYTSDTILINETTTNGIPKYEWGCYCKDSDKFRQETPLKDCVIEQICGADIGDGELWVQYKDDMSCAKDSDCSAIGGKCCPKSNGIYGSCDSDNTGDKKCFVKWSSQSNTDPAMGRCECKDGLTFKNLNGDMICTPDSCAPNGKYNGLTQKCTCNTNFINCPTCKSTSPQCIPDPCQPGGTYTGGTCKCETVDGKFYTTIVNPHSPVGHSCVDLCSGNNLCGDRGTCVVYSHDLYDSLGNLTTPYCKNCTSPYCNTVIDNTKKVNEACPVKIGSYCGSSTACEKYQDKKSCQDAQCTWTNPVYKLCDYMLVS
jgi:hypothetical protein